MLMHMIALSTKLLLVKKNASWYFLFSPHDVIWFHIIRLIDDKYDLAVD